MSGEAKLEAKLSAAVRLAGGVAIKVGHSGWPDRVVVLPSGCAVWVELKSPTGKGRVSELQKHRIETLRKLGHDARVISSEEDFPC